MKYIITLLALFTINYLSAQEQSTKLVEKSDVEAIAILDKIKANLESHKNFEIDFNMEIHFPRTEEVEIQKGTLKQEGEKFDLSLPNQHSVSDGQTLWIHLIEQNEVQINWVEEMEGELYSPIAFLDLYKSDDFICAFVNKFEKEGKILNHIEFKPIKGDYNDIFKVKLISNDKDKSIKAIHVFFKNGGRFFFNVNQMEFNLPFVKDNFIFIPEALAGIYIEDLR